MATTTPPAWFRGRARTITERVAAGQLRSCSCIAEDGIGDGLPVIPLWQEDTVCRADCAHVVPTPPVPCDRCGGSTADGWHVPEGWVVTAAPDTVPAARFYVAYGLCNRCVGTR